MVSEARSDKLMNECFLSLVAFIPRFYCAYILLMHVFMNRNINLQFNNGNNDLLVTERLHKDKFERRVFCEIDLR